MVEVGNGIGQDTRGQGEEGVGGGGGGGDPPWTAEEVVEEASCSGGAVDSPFLLVVVLQISLWCLGPRGAFCWLRW
ncbi:unnamed protein product [Camellia sinensis]